MLASFQQLDPPAAAASTSLGFMDFLRYLSRFVGCFKHSDFGFVLLCFQLFLVLLSTTVLFRRHQRTRFHLGSCVQTNKRTNGQTSVQTDVTRAASRRARKSRGVPGRAEKSEEE